jgi:oxysterol-binding protein-related protein 8
MHATQSGQKEMFFNALQAKPTTPRYRPIEEQDERESVKLWQKTAQAVKDKNHELATEEKSKIEDRQREEAARRNAEGIDWKPRLFRPVKANSGEAEEGLEDLEWIIKQDMYVLCALAGAEGGDTIARLTDRTAAPLPHRRNKLSRY